MSRETNIAAQERFGAAINSGDLDALTDLLAPDSVDPDPAPGQGPGPEGYRVMFRGVQIGRFENGKLVERWAAATSWGC